MSLHDEMSFALPMEAVHGQAGPPPCVSGPSAARVRTPAEIQDWLVAHLARVTRLSLDRIDVTAPFDTFGLDSVQAIGMTGELEQWLALRIDPMAVYDYPTIEALAAHLGERARTQRGRA